MKKVIFLSAAASLSMAVKPTPEELQKWFRQDAIALRADDASDDTFYWVHNDNGRRYADDEQDTELYWVHNDNGRRYADDELWSHGDSSLGLRRDDEVADNNLIINKIKDGYYTATNWALQNPDKVHQVVNFGANMLMNPKWDDELVQKNVAPEKLKKSHEKKKVVVPEAHDNNLIINKIKDGYYTATNWALQNPDKVHQVVNFGANMLMNPKWDDELVQKNVVQERLRKSHEKKKVVVPEAHDNNLIINKIKDGYYTATNWALQNPDKVHQVVNFGANMLMNPKWDDELMVRKKHHKPTQQVEQTEQSAQPAPIHLKKKKGGKFRPIAQPQPVQTQPEVQVADNSLFDLGALLDDAEN